MAARKQADVATDRGQSGIVPQRLCLHRQAVAVHQVVGVHAGNEGGTAPLQPGVQGGNDAPVGRADDLETRVTGSEVAGAGQGVVLRASSTITQCHRASLWRCTLRRQAGRVGAAFQAVADGDAGTGRTGHVFLSFRVTCLTIRPVLNVAALIPDTQYFDSVINDAVDNGEWRSRD